MPAGVALRHRLRGFAHPTKVLPQGLIRGVFVVAARPWTFNRFREEMTRSRLSDFDVR
jgi:hypothetical protein